MANSDISQWVGRSETQHAVLDLAATRRLVATVGGPPPAPHDPMPLLAHWCAFTPLAGMADLGQDGHPHLGGFMPPIPLARRMWAGGNLTFHAPLHIGVPITRTSTITAVTEKDGAAGTMVFVTLRHELHEGATHAITETQDIVYLDIPETFSPPPPKPVPTDPDLLEAAPVSEALLFRYSAVTFNAHRIHYDMPYAKQVEKYPGLVVHGPLQATLLINAAQRHAPERRPQQFSFRGVRPLFHFDDMHLFGTQTEGGMTLCTGLRGGHQGMQAKVIWEDTE